MNISIKILLLSLLLILVQSCATTPADAGSDADFAIPGCEPAWGAIDAARALAELRALVVNDCAELYRYGWRLPIGGNNGGRSELDVCQSAVKTLMYKGQLENVKFMVTHNCPTFYRNRWVIPPTRD